MTLENHPEAENTKILAQQRQKTLKPEAVRALAEAQARRTTAAPPVLAPEIAGRDGPEPVRYGDWEVKGIASDF